jgi:membrane protease YdiL (CAAX protease family)
MLRSSAAKLRAAVLYSSWTALAVLAGSSILLAIFIGPLIAVWPPGKDFFHSSLGTLMLYALQYIFALFVVLTVPYIQQAGKWRLILPQLGFVRDPRFVDFLKALVAWILYFGATFVVLAAVNAFFPDANLNQQQDVGFDGISLPYEYILAFIALVVLPPLAEESIFRGFLFGKLRNSMGFWPAALATSLTFGIVHMQLNVGIDVFVLSLFLCYLREKTGSIWASVFLHSLKNGVAYAFLFILR